MCQESVEVVTREGVVPGEPFSLAGLVDYTPGSITSRIIQRGGAGSVTVFAIEAGEEIGEHSTPCDALAMVLDGAAEVEVGEQSRVVEQGQMVLMPARVPHSLRARRRFKMLLVMLRG